MPEEEECVGRMMRRRQLCEKDINNNVYSSIDVTN